MIWFHRFYYKNGIEKRKIKWKTDFVEMKNDAAEMKAVL